MRTEHQHEVEHGMPRPPADTVQVTFRIPSHWIQEADALALTLSIFGRQVTRTDAFREAMARGFKAIEEDAKKGSRFRISAYDGRNGTCLFWFGPDQETAFAEAKRLAREHAGGRWTVFRVFDARKEDEETAAGKHDHRPIHTEMVARGGRR